MREIADRVGLTDAGVMHHFDSKEQLLLAVLEHREAISRQGRPRQQGLALLDDLRELVARNATMPGLIQLFVTVSAEATDPDHPAHEFFVARYEEVTRYFADQLAAARDAGQVRADADLTAAAQQLIAMMDGLQVQYLLTKVDMVAAFDQFLEGFRRTLGIRGARIARRHHRPSDCAGPVEIKMEKVPGKPLAHADCWRGGRSRQQPRPVRDLYPAGAAGLAGVDLQRVDRLPAAPVDDAHDAHDALAQQRHDRVGIPRLRRGQHGRVLQEAADRFAGVLLVRADDPGRPALDPARDVFPCRRHAAAQHPAARIRHRTPVLVEWQAAGPRDPR